MKTRALLFLPILLVTPGLLYSKDNAPVPAAAAKADAGTRQVVRIYAIKAILGVLPAEDDEAGKKVRVQRWDSLMSLIDTALVMAGCEEPRPALGPHGESNCLVAGGTADPIALITQAISACMENEQPRSPSVMPVRVLK